MESIKTCLLIIILIYTIVITVLYWTEYTNKQQYLHDKSRSLNNKDIELTRREKSIVDKEVCFRELTKLQTIQNSALTLLKSYNDTYIQNFPSQQIQPQHTIIIPENTSFSQEIPKAESESFWTTMLSALIKF
jgi:hypothetical protein